MISILLPFSIFFSQFSIKKKTRTRIKASKDQDIFFVVALKRVVGNVLTMGYFISFLSFSLEVFLWYVHVLNNIIYVASAFVEGLRSVSCNGVLW